MANTNFKRIVRDGYDNAVVELVGTLDTSAATFTVNGVIALADFTGSAPNPSPTFTGLRLDEIQYSMSDALAAQFWWNATADQVMVNVAGRGKLCFKEAGGILPDRAAAGYDGSIDLAVNNIVVAAGTPIQTYTFLLFFKKLYG